jgi:hypothetical protein
LQRIRDLASVSGLSYATILEALIDAAHTTVFAHAPPPRPAGADRGGRAAGGRARWAGVSAEERSQYARHIARRRWDRLRNTA